MPFLRYAIRLDAPARHVVAIEGRFSTDGLDRVELTMPARSPGSYLIRDYARFVRDLEVTDADGAPRATTKLDKATWVVETAGATELVVRYLVYGHDLSVRTNHVDGTHALLHGPATFVFPRHLRAGPVDVELRAPIGWRLTTALAWEPVASHAQFSPINDQEPPWRFSATDVDELLDSPIHVGLAAVYQVAARVPVKLVVWGERAPGGAFDEVRLLVDLGAIVDDHVARFGDGPVPFEHYTFVLMLAHDAYGGLEHRASSVNLFHPHFGASKKAYENLLELLSHELFHAWNGKRIAPRVLLDFDYAREAYTPCLWVMEGLTSHYDRFALRTSGRITAKSLLEKILDDWTRLQATPGRAKQSLEAASFDAWIKLYRPDESNLNTTVSYYLKGGLAMFALDLHVRRRTEGSRSLDDVLRLLWRRYGVTREPHPDELQPIFEEATGLALGEIFARQIRGTADPDLAAELSHVGLELRASIDPSTIAEGAHALWIGATVSGIKVTGVFDDGPAWVAGLSPGDEIVAIDRFRTTSEADLRNFLGARRLGETVTLAVFRRHRLVDVSIVLATAPPTRYEIVAVAEPGPAAQRYAGWIGEPHPTGQTLTSVTTTARWV